MNPVKTPVGYYFLNELCSNRLRYLVFLWNQFKQIDTAQVGSSTNTVTVSVASQAAVPATAVTSLVVVSLMNAVLSSVMDSPPGNA